MNDEKHEMIKEILEMEEKVTELVHKVYEYHFDHGNEESHIAADPERLKWTQAGEMDISKGFLCLTRSIRMEDS